MAITFQWARIPALFCCAILLTGCLGDSGGSSSKSAAPPATGGSDGGSTGIPSNRAPTISGTPATAAKTQQPYVFQPSATDPDGDAITFTIANKPAWATFDTKTGRLAGTPSSTYTGKFSGIRISVSDGTNTSSLAAFEINVAATTVSGTATLRWAPPTENIDGSPLTNLAGYIIRYGTSLTVPGQELRIGSPDITSAVVENLGPGTWYFTVSAFTTAGVESAASNAGSKTIG
jgi:hypothetical protein